MVDESNGFKVVDRRSFDRDGQEQTPSEPGSTPGERADAASAEPARPPSECAEPGGPTDSLPEVDFITFVLSLHNSAACLLGRAPYPDTGTCSVNLPMAKQTIDIISLLQDKTKGNLTGEEERILAEILYDLRMVYVQAVQK